MKTELLEEILLRAEKDPLELVPATAKFLDFSASGEAQLIVNYNQKLNKLYSLHQGVPFVNPLIQLTDGTANFYLTNYKDALKSIEKGIESFKPGMPTDILGALYWARGLVYRSLGELDLAVENELDAVNSINQDNHFKLTYAYALYQLGELHISIKEYREALEFYKRAFAAINDNNDTTANFRIINGLGNCHLILKEYPKAHKHLDEALSIKDISSAERSRGLCDIGILLIHQEQYVEAIEYLLRSLKIRKESNLEDAASTSLIQLGKVYYLLGSYDESLKVLEEALVITAKFNTLSKKILVLKWLHLTYEKLGKVDLAFDALKQYDQLNTEIRNKQEHKIFKLKNGIIEQQKKEVFDKNTQLKETLDELAKVKNSRKSLIFSIITAIILVILTEVFLDPIIESYSYNEVISLGVKVLIALMLKPMESLYERILFRKAMRLK